MRTIQIADKTYAQLDELLKEEQPGQIERHGEVISETPEDMIPWLLGYYRGMQKSYKKEPSKIVNAGGEKYV